MNDFVTSAFDVLLWPLDRLGDGWAIVLASGLFGIVGLVAFKYVSFQRHIKAAKDKVKGHLIEIRLYQDDLVVVAKAFCMVMLRNLQYLAYNFVSMVPLLVVFVFVLVQFVVRYAFDPVPVHDPRIEVAAEVLPGQGTVVTVQLAAGHEADAAGLLVELPPGLRARSRLVRSADDGRAWQEVVAVEPGVHEIAFVLPGGARTTKTLVAGDDPPRTMQPERSSGFWGALLWPVEDAFGDDSPFERVSFTYPDRDLGWLPGGVVGVLLVFLVASMVFGALVIKPLKVQI